MQTGVTYIAQVLKRNRTLKVLNISDNKIEPAGLAAIAESLKYNSTLETLDISSNPCGGPVMDGVSLILVHNRISLTQTDRGTPDGIHPQHLAEEAVPVRYRNQLRGRHRFG